MADQAGVRATSPNSNGNFQTPEELHAARQSLDRQLRATWKELAQHNAEAERSRTLDRQTGVICGGVAERIGTLEKEIVQMKTRRNAMASVFRLLPMEILFQIMMLCDSSDSHKGLTHSCRHWRDTTVACPEMWSTIQNASQFKMHLQMSRSAPLSIYLDLTSLHLDVRRGKFICDALSSHARRIRRLELNLRLSQFASVLSALTSTPAPLLEDLCISDNNIHYLHQQVNDVEGTHDYPWPYPLMALPSSFLNNHVPKLHRLILVGCVPSWNLDIFSNLTEFLVDAFLDHPSVPVPSGRHFLGALSRMTRLVKLQLQLPLPDMSRSKFPDISPILLVHLQELRLESSVVGCTGFMEHVRLPETSVVRLYLGTPLDHPTTEPSDAESLALGASLHAAWGSAPLHPNPSELPKLSLKVDDKTLVLSRTSHDPQGQGTSTNSAASKTNDVTLGELEVSRLRGSMRRGLSDGHFHCVISGLSLESTLYKLKHKEDLPDPSCWSMVLQGLSALIYLHLTRRGAAQFLTWLSDNGLDQSSARLGHLSQIETLSFRDVSFSRTLEHVRSTRWLYYVALLPVLHRFIGRLAEARLRTHAARTLTLKFNSCTGLEDSDYEEMKLHGAAIILKDSDGERRRRNASLILELLGPLGVRQGA